MKHPSNIFIMIFTHNIIYIWIYDILKTPMEATQPVLTGFEPFFASGLQ